MATTRPTTCTDSRGHDHKEARMKFEYAYDRDTFGFALFWNGPMPNVPLLSEHTIIFILFNFRFGISW